MRCSWWPRRWSDRDMHRRRCASCRRTSLAASPSAARTPFTMFPANPVIPGTHTLLQMAQGLAGVQLQVEALPAVLEERFAQLEGRQAVTDRRLAAVEQRLEAGERRAAVVQSESSASSLTALPDTAALPAVRLQERAVVPTAAARPRQASTAAAAAAAAAGAAADGRSAAELPPTSAASSATPLQQPGGHRIRIGDHCFASMDDVRALIKQLKCDLLDRPIRSDAKQHGPIFR